MKIQLVKNNITNSFVYIIAFFLILSSGTVYQYLIDGKTFSRIIQYVPVFLLVIVPVLIERPKIAYQSYNNSIIIIGSVIVYFTILTIISGSRIDSSMTTILLLVTIMFYFFTIEQNSEPRLLLAYKNIIFFLAVMSLIFWIFGSNLKLISYNYINTTWADYDTLFSRMKSYHMLHFERETTFLFGNIIISNRSIFVERAYAAFNFSIALMCELLIEKNKKPIKIIILTIALLSTVSITGLINVILIYLFYYIFNGNNKTIIKLLKFLTLPIVISIGTFVIMQLVLNKMSYGNSYLSRFNDFYNGLNAWKDSPLWGYGYGRTETISSRFNTGQSNSITGILTQGGVLLLIPYVYAFINSYKKNIRSNDKNMLIFTTVFLIIFIFTAVAFRTITFYVLTFICFSNNEKNKMRESLYK